MPALPREVLEDFIARWMDANRDAERKGDWTGLAEFLAGVEAGGAAMAGPEPEPVRGAAFGSASAGAK